MLFLRFAKVVLLTSNDPDGPESLPRALADRLDGSAHLRLTKKHKYEVAFRERSFKKSVSFLLSRTLEKYER